MFTKDVGRVAYATDMNEAKDMCCDRAPSLVVCQRIVTLVEFGIRNGSCVHDQFIVPKYNGRPLNWHTKILEGFPNVNDLFPTRPGCGALWKCTHVCGGYSPYDLVLGRL